MNFIEKLTNDFKDIIKLKSGILKEVKVKQLIESYSEEEKLHLTYILKISEYINFMKLPKPVLGNYAKLEDNYLAILTELYNTSSSYRNYTAKIRKLPTYFQQFLFIFMNRNIFLHITKKQASTLLPRFKVISKNDILTLFEAQKSKNTTQLPIKSTNLFKMLNFINLPTTFLLPNISNKRDSVKFDICFFSKRGKIYNQIGKVSKEITNLFDVYTFSVLILKYRVNNKTFYSIIGVKFGFLDVNTVDEVLEYIDLKSYKLSDFKEYTKHNYSKLKNKFVQTYFREIEYSPINELIPSNFKNYIVYSKNKLYNYVPKVYTKTLQVLDIIFNKEKGIYDKIKVNHLDSELELPVKSKLLLESVNSFDSIDRLRKGKTLYINVKFILNGNKILKATITGKKVFSLSKCRICGKVLNHKQARFCPACYFGIRHIIEAEMFDYKFPVYKEFRGSEFSLKGYVFKDKGEGFEFVRSEKVKQRALPLFVNNSKLSNSLNHFDRIRQENHSNLLH